MNPPYLPSSRHQGLMYLAAAAALALAIIEIALSVRHIRPDADPFTTDSDFGWLLFAVAVISLIGLAITIIGLSALRRGASRTWIFVTARAAYGTMGLAPFGFPLSAICGQSALAAAPAVLCTVLFLSIGKSVYTYIANVAEGR